VFEEMVAAPAVVLIGEDFVVLRRRVSRCRRASEKFGWERVIETPISDPRSWARPVGMGYAGLRPVAEMQFIDFIACCCLVEPGHKFRSRKVATNHLLGRDRRWPLVVASGLLAAAACTAGGPSAKSGNVFRAYAVLKSGLPRRRPTTTPRVCSSRRSATTIRAFFRTQIPLPAGSKKNTEVSCCFPDRKRGAWWRSARGCWRPGSGHDRELRVSMAGAVCHRWGGGFASRHRGGRRLEKCCGSRGCVSRVIDLRRWSAARPRTILSRSAIRTSCSSLTRRHPPGVSPVKSQRGNGERLRDLDGPIRRVTSLDTRRSRTRRNSMIFLRPTRRRLFAARGNWHTIRIPVPVTSEESRV